MAENHEKPSFTFFAFLPPYIGVSSSLVPRNGQISMRSIDWYQKILVSCLAARYSSVFVLRCSKWLKIAKNNFLRFLLFYPLYWRFRLSRVSHAQDLDEIYRLVSKILNFMPWGSLFGRFCVFYCKNRFPKIKFAIEPCRREVLGRPVARYSAVFVFYMVAGPAMGGQRRKTE